MDPNQRSQEVWTTLKFPLLGCMVFGMILCPILLGFQSASHGAPRPQCIGNVRQLAAMNMMYVSDYDDRLPFAKRWMDDLYPYAKNERIYHCTAFNDQSGQPSSSLYGYAMNRRVAH